MPARFPSFSTDEQQELLKEIQHKTLFPFTYQITTGIANPPFATSDGAGSFFQISFTAPNTLALIALQLSFTISALNASTFGICVSYGNTVSFNNTLPTTDPTDTGNEIYKALYIGTNQYNDFVFFMPNNYYLAKGQKLFIYPWAQTAAIGAGLSMFGSVTLHTQLTGLQS